MRGWVVVLSILCRGLNLSLQRQGGQERNTLYWKGATLKEQGKGLSDSVRSVGTGVATRASHEDEGGSCPKAPVIFLKVGGLPVRGYADT